MDDFVAAKSGLEVIYYLEGLAVVSQHVLIPKMIFHYRLSVLQNLKACAWADGLMFC